MKRSTPYARAAVCFALARSTTHAGERANAIAAGELICRRHRLSLDLFDIPGRVRGRDTFDAARDQARRRAAALQEMAAAVAAAAETIGAGPDEAFADARRRNFEAAIAAARERDDWREASRRAADYLSSQRITAYRTGVARWTVYHADGSIEDCCDMGLVALATRTAMAVA